MQIMPADSILECRYEIFNKVLLQKNNRCCLEIIFVIA